MDVLMVVPWLARDAGGAAAATVTASRVLAARGHNVTVVTTDAALPSNALGFRRLGLGEVADLEARVHPAALRVFPVGRPRRLAWSPALDRFLASAVVTADVVNVHTLWLRPSMQAMDESRRRRVPYLVWPHGALSPAFRARGRLRKAVVAQLWQRRGLAGAAGFVVASSLEAGWMGEIAPGAARHVVPHPIGAAIGAGASPGTRERVAEVVWAGRLGPVKRPDLAIRILAALDADLSMVLVGPDSSHLWPSLRALAEELGVADRVTYVGALEPAALHARIAQATLTLVASDSESWSLVAGESLAVGTPVAVRGGVGISELVRRHGAGLVIGDEPAAAAAAIDRLVQDPAAYRAAVDATANVRDAATEAAVGAALERVMAGVSR